MKFNKDGLSGELYFEELNHSHIAEIKKWGIHEDPLLWEYNLSELSSFELNVWYFDRKKSINTRYYAVYLDEDMVAYFGFKEINWILRTASLGISMDPNMTSRGLGSEIMEGLLDLYFKEMRMRVLRLDVNNFNLRARRLYQKYGFKETGQGMVYYPIEKENLDILNNEDYFIRRFGKVYSKTTKMELERGAYNEIQSKRGQA